MNLFHHAVEMMIKCDLAKTLTVKDLRALGHKLGDLWIEFKRRNSGANLSHLDPAIDNLSRCEVLRYPDWLPSGGATYGIVPTEADKGKASGSANTYVMSLEEIDQLFAELIVTLGVQDLFQVTMMGPATAQTYAERNLHRLF